MHELTAELKRFARSLGFRLAGVTPAVDAGGFSNLLDWLERGYAGEMHYLDGRREAYRHPSGVLPGVRSLVLLGFPYRTAEPQTPRRGAGRIARYAWGEADYHDLIHERLKKIRRWLLERHRQAAVRGVVDTAPLLEREFAQLAGIGWRGKNTLLINKWEGSYLFLAALLTDLELEPDAPHATDHCGTCRACLDACPTDAFPQPGVLDARRCISYLTIEHRGPVPRELRRDIGDWLFGCDVCQDVCPWNRRGGDAEVRELWPAADQNPVDLAELFEMDDEGFRRRFRKTPLWRAKRRGILRNAAIVLGNGRDPGNIPPLARGVADPEPVVRGASAWALGEIGGRQARQLLEQRRALEENDEVRGEIAAALDPE